MSRTISIGLAGKNLKDRDFFGVSDPYCTISRPEPSGGFRKIRTSETKMNTLNPSWNDFLFNEDELNGADKELKLMYVHCVFFTASDFTSSVLTFQDPGL